MDRARFDQLARGLAADMSRRGMVRTLGGAAIGGILLMGGANEAGARKKKRGGKPQGRLSQSAAANKVAVCHYDADTETWALITVSQNGWNNGHAKHHEKDYRLTGECCTDVDCAGDKSCCDGLCTDGGRCHCTSCGDGCPGDPEHNPTETYSFTPTGDPYYCGVIVNLTGFAGCTSYTAEYWGAIDTNGSGAYDFGPVTLGPTDLSGSSQTNLGTFANGQAVDIRINGAASGWHQVIC